MRIAAITTIDNPYDPFDQFTNWWRYDQDKGYKTCEQLARFARTTDQFSDKENAIEIERAIDDMIKYDPFDRYIKVVREESD